VGEPEVIDALGYMIGEFIGQAEAEPQRCPVGPDQIHAGNFRFLSRVEGEGGGNDRAAGRSHATSVSLVKPFRLYPGCAGLRFAALEAHAKHLHGVSLLGCVGGRAVHLVATFRGTEMGEPGARQVQPGGLGMIDRGEERAVILEGFEIDNFSAGGLANGRIQAGFLGHRLGCEIKH
jgi:hypothetical protein